MCMDLSRDPLAKYSPFGLNATEYTGSLVNQLKSTVNNDYKYETIKKLRSRISLRAPRYCNDPKPPKHFTPELARY